MNNNIMLKYLLLLLYYLKYKYISEYNLLENKQENNLYIITCKSTFSPDLKIHKIIYYT